MDLSTNDFTKLQNSLETMQRVLEWQADEPTPAKILPLVRSCLKVLTSYLDPDEISTMSFPDSLDNPEDLEDENY